MRKVLLTLFAGLCLGIFFATSALADTKIATLNMQELVQSLPEMKTIGDNLKKEFADKEAKLKTAQAAFKKSYEDFNRNAATMADKDKQAATQKLLQDEQNLKQMQMNFQKDYVAAQGKQVNGLLERIKAQVAVVAKAGGYDYVLLSEVAPYAPANVDITSAVQSAMGKK